MGREHMLQFLLINADRKAYTFKQMVFSNVNPNPEFMARLSERSLHIYRKEVAAIFRRAI